MAGRSRGHLEAHEKIAVQFTALGNAILNGGETEAGVIEAPLPTNSCSRWCPMRLTFTMRPSMPNLNYWSI
jgi:hypothetical protein